MRKVIQVTTAANPTGLAFIALCDDGSMWEMLSGQWQQIEGVPQPDALALCRVVIPPTVTPERNEFGAENHLQPPSRQGAKRVRSRNDKSS